MPSPIFPPHHHWITTRCPPPQLRLITHPAKHVCARAWYLFLYNPQISTYYVMITQKPSRKRGSFCSLLKALLKRIFPSPHKTRTFWKTHYISNTNPTIHTLTQYPNQSHHITITESPPNIYQQITTQSPLHWHYTLSDSPQGKSNSLCVPLQRLKLLGPSVAWMRTFGYIC